MLIRSHRENYPACYKEPSFAMQYPQEILTGYYLPNDWLADLITIFQNFLDQQCKGSVPGAKKIDVDDHIRNRHLPYPGSDRLEKNLAVIFARLTGQLDEQLGILSSDDRNAFLSVLTEDIDKCSDGFHDRMCNGVAGFVLPKNIDDLLFKARMGIVERVSTIISSEEQTKESIHYQSHCYYTAMINGYAVCMPNPYDKNVGLGNDSNITALINEEFERCYHSLALIDLLIEQIKIQLSSKNYLKIIEEYKTGQLNIFNEIIAKFVDEFENKKGTEEFWSQYFVFDENDIPVNYDWGKIEVALLDQLSQQNYFLEYTEENKYEWIFERVSLLTKYNPVGLFEFFENDPSWCALEDKEKHQLLVEVNQEGTHVLGLAMKYHPKYIDNIIPMYQGASDREKIKALSEALKLPMDVLTFDKLLAIQSEEILKKCYENGIFLRYAVQYQSMEFVQSVLEKHESRGVSQNALINKDKRGNTLLMLAAQYNPGVFPLILSKLSGCHEEENTLLAKNSEGDNVVDLASKVHPECLDHLSKELSGKFPDRQLELKAELAKKGWGYSSNIVLNEAKVARKEEKYYSLSFISDLSYGDQRSYFFQKDNKGRSALMLAAMNNPLKFKCLLTHLYDNHKQSKSKGLYSGMMNNSWRFLQQKTYYDDSVLMFAAKYKPDSLKVLAAHEIMNNPGKFYSAGTQLYQLLTAKNARGLNAFQVAVISNNNSLQELIPFFEKFEPHTNAKLKCMREILTGTCYNGKNLLMLAAVYSPDDIDCVAKMIDEFKGDEKDLLLENLLCHQSDKYKNTALMLLLESRPKCAHKIFGLVKKISSPKRKTAVLKKMFSVKRADGSGVMALFARYADDDWIKLYLEPLLDMGLSSTDVYKFFLAKNGCEENFFVQLLAQGKLNQFFELMAYEFNGEKIIDDSRKKEVIHLLLVAKDSSEASPLMRTIAALKDPKDVEKILNFIEGGDKKDIKKALLRVGSLNHYTSDVDTVFSIASKKESPDIFLKLIEFVEKIFEDDQSVKLEIFKHAFMNKYSRQNLINHAKSDSTGKLSGCVNELVEHYPVTSYVKSFCAFFNSYQVPMISKCELSNMQLSMSQPQAS